jgi:hypothetical protein
VKEVWHVYALWDDRYYDLGDHDVMTREEAIRLAVEKKTVPDGSKLYAFRKKKETKS